MRAAAEPVVDVEGEPGSLALKRDVDAGESTYYHGPVLRSSGRGKTTRAQDLQRVADIYRRAIAAGLPPTQAVADQFPCSRSYAGYLVRQARTEGYLGGTTAGRAGEERQAAYEAEVAAELERATEHLRGQIRNKPRRTDAQD
jgi:hypothetical protein